MSKAGAAVKNRGSRRLTAGVVKINEVRFTFTDPKGSANNFSL